MEQTLNRLSKVLIFFLAYSIIFVLFFYTLPYTLPFVLALIFALILKKPTLFLMKKFKIKESISTLITTVIFFAIIITLLSLAISSIVGEIINLTKNIPVLVTNNYDYITSLLNTLQDNFNNIDPSLIHNIEASISSSASKLVNGAVNLGSSIVGFLLNIISSIPYIVMVFIFTLISTYLFTKKFTKFNYKNSLKIFNDEDNNIPYILGQSKRMITNYICSYAFLILLSFTLTLIGFSVFKVKYALMLSILCAILDLLPVVGMPLVYFPIIIINFVNGNYSAAIGLSILYVIIFIGRQILEPKIVSSSLGLDPVAVLAAIFIGLKANGFIGMIFCIFLVVTYNILKKVDIL